MITFLRQLLAFILFIIALVATLVLAAVFIPLFWLLQCLEIVLDLLIEVIFVPFGGIDEFEDEEKNETYQDK